MAKSLIHPLKDPILTDNLDFDRENPRYAPYHKLGKASDEEIVKFLSLTSDLKEIIQSISANGYINVESLIVTKAPKSKGKYIVLEGNRRLAAIKLLKDPKFAEKCDFRNLPTLNKDKQATLKAVYATEVADRDQARALIGFKHINGPQKWDSFAKAKFAKDWYIEGKRSGITISKIAESLGDGHSTIRRLVFGIFVLDQAITNGLFTVPDRFFHKRVFPFSHLYTALSKAGYQKYLGIEGVWQEEDPPQNPVPKKNLSNLKQVLLWLYGSTSDEIEPVIKSQNPDLKKLGDILGKPKAIKTLEVKKDLDVAYLDVQPPLELFETSLINAHKYAEEALSRMSAYEGGEDTIVEVSSTLAKNSKIIHQHIISFRKK